MLTLADKGGGVWLILKSLKKCLKMALENRYFYPNHQDILKKLSKKLLPSKKNWFCKMRGSLNMCKKN